MAGRKGGSSFGNVLLLVIVLVLIWSLVLGQPVWEWSR